MDVTILRYFSRRLRVERLATHYQFPWQRPILAVLKGCPLVGDHYSHGIADGTFYIALRCIASRAERDCKG